MAGTVELEEIIRAELRPYVATIVEELIPQLVAEAVNGTNGNGQIETRARVALAAAHTAQDRTPDPIPTGTVGNVSCRVCGQQKPESAFDAGRRTCRSCRHQQHREREARKAAEEEPGPAVAPGDTDSPAT